MNLDDYKQMAAANQTEAEIKKDTLDWPEQRREWPKNGNKKD